MTKKRVTISIDKDILEQIDRNAKKERRSRSAQIEKIVEEYYNNNPEINTRIGEVKES